MARNGTSTRRRRNSWLENVQLRRERVRIDRERSIREMNQQVERETRHNAAPTPTWLLREVQRVSETPVVEEVRNRTIDTSRSIHDGERNIDAPCLCRERDARHIYLQPATYNSFVPGRPTLHNFMALPHECLENAISEIDQPRDDNPRIREGHNEYGLDLTLRLGPSAEPESTSAQLPARFTNSSTLKVVSLAHLRDDHHT